MRASRTDAEVIILDNETVFVEKRRDIESVLHKRVAGPWQAVWLKVVVHADTRDEAVRVMADRIERKKALKLLEEYFRQKRIRKAVDDLVATRRPLE
ncbi:MAG: hypothetical protein K4305_08965 [Chlorobium sp.]|uniref:hypothetical protein n=1 Tax=Chlorobium sp. TaxID=1095 RepID=UPI002F3EE6BF